MSFETLIWVRSQKTGGAVRRAVLRVLADHAGQDFSCYLRTRLIAAETELSEATVRNALAALVEQGFIRICERYHANGSRKTNRYQLLVDGPETPMPDAEDWADVREAPPADGGGTPADGGGTPGAGGGTLRELEGFPSTEASSSEATPVKGPATRPALPTRIPDGFKPTEKMAAWFADEKLDQVIDGRTEHAKFVDYWLGVPGTKGRKLDWAATWRVWMRSAADRAPRQPGNSMAPVSGAPFRPSTTDQKVAQTLELGRRLQEEDDAR